MEDDHLHDLQVMDTDKAAHLEMAAQVAEAVAKLRSGQGKRALANEALYIAQKIRQLKPAAPPEPVKPSCDLMHPTEACTVQVSKPCSATDTCKED